MTDPELYERIAVVEAKLEIFEQSQKAILTQLEELNRNMTRYKGFVGGVTFIVSAIWAFLTFAKDWVLAHLK